ncbi:LOW QUALITY PROTEIN: hypothetical protein Cgig2_008762 [Carnegiea gigantea]|uniref:Uncharacterized protein n=1 Tax=Carnegiea gigantea TaxID=171969 RepID=A0A9Q1K6L4_9CARY|nr:LOW QUALITY PROTEIN: hypothetical protein Cgig2_008762 [Carnegiea gigantea]
MMIDEIARGNKIQLSYYEKKLLIKSVLSTNGREGSGSFLCQRYKCFLTISFFNNIDIIVREHDDAVTYRAKGTFLYTLDLITMRFSSILRSLEARLNHKMYQINFKRLWMHVNYLMLGLWVVNSSGGMDKVIATKSRSFLIVVMLQKIVVLEDMDEDLSDYLPFLIRSHLNSKDVGGVRDAVINCMSRLDRCMVKLLRWNVEGFGHAQREIYQCKKTLKLTILTLERRCSRSFNNGGTKGKFYSGNVPRRIFYNMETLTPTDVSTLIIQGNHHPKTSVLFTKGRRLSLTRIGANAI